MVYVRKYMEKNELQKVDLKNFSGFLKRSLQLSCDCCMDARKPPKAGVP